MRAVALALLLVAGALAVPALALAAPPELPDCSVPIHSERCPTPGSRTYVCDQMVIEACTYE